MTTQTTVMLKGAKSGRQLEGYCNSPREKRWTEPRQNQWGQGEHLRENFQRQNYKNLTKCHRSLKGFQFELWVNEDIYRGGMIVIWVIHQIFSTFSHSTRTHAGVTFSGLILCLLTSLMLIKVYRLLVIRWVYSGGLMYCNVIIINDAILHT